MTENIWSDGLLSSLSLGSEIIAPISKATGTFETVNDAPLGTTKIWTVAGL